MSVQQAVTEVWEHSAHTQVIRNLSAQDETRNHVFLKNYLFFERERDRETERKSVKERERNPSRLCPEHGAGCGARSQNPEITT